MSASDDTRPTLENLRAVQTWLNHLDDLSESQPQAVIDATQDGLPLLAAWTGNDAYAWALALRAKAFRFLDRLSDVLDAAESGLRVAHGEDHVGAHLHLEAGMALNQFGRLPEAAEHLEAAAKSFEAAGDDGGRAWALVSLAEAYTGSGSSTDPEPVLRLAINLANQSGDQRAARRGWKQLAVLHRLRGEPAEALDAVWRAVDGDMSAHTRANYLLELGHLLAWVGNYVASDDAYQDASAAYAEHSDLLGQANVERALASNALILGRHIQGARRLDRAAELYRRIDSGTGLGYILRDRALVRLASGDHGRALADVEEGLASFRKGSDSIGLAGMLRVAARIYHVTGDLGGVEAALAEARSLNTGVTNPLGEAGLLSLEAEIADPASLRLVSGLESARLYGGMGIFTGKAFALSQVARAQADLEDVDGAVATILDAAATLRAARSQITDPGRRGDHDFALRDVCTNLLDAAARLGDKATGAMADLIVDDAPLGLRAAFKEGRPGKEATRFISRVKSMQPQPPEDSVARRHLLQQLGATLASVEPDQDPAWISFDDLAAKHPEDALLAYGSPTRNGHLPIAWRLPGGEVHVDLTVLDDSSVDQIDALGYAFSADRAEVLWSPKMRSWQTHLVDVMLPSQVRDWLTTNGSPSLTVLLPPVLAHVPIEALLLRGQPVGIRAAVARLSDPTSATIEANPRKTFAYLDPALSWGPERTAVPTFTHDARKLRAALGPNRLLVVACHGESAIQAEGALISSDGARVADALDLLVQPLTGSVVLLEACFAGRYMGPRTGEPLTLATVSLLAGASSVVAGLFALPADDACTGIIAAHLIRELAAGTPAPEALRRARQMYWSARPDRLGVPGESELFMTGDAPWGWAGLCAFTR